MIFISYRHSDAAYARALQLALERQVGAELVMRDVKESHRGGDLRDLLTQQVSESDTVLVLIGPAWMGADPDRAQSSASENRDWVRFELSLALAWRKRVVPLLLGGVAMPLRSTLPGDVAAIADLLALQLRDGDWEADTTRLWRHLGFDAPKGAEPPGPPAGPSVINDVGPVAGGNITISGENVAGRDGYF